MKQWMTGFNFPTLFRVLRLLGKQKVLFIALLLGFCVVELACTVLSTTGIKGAINALVTSDAGLFWSSTIYLLLSGVIWWIYAPISWYGTRFATKGRVCDLKADLLEHIIRLPMRFHDGISKGELLSAFSNDINCLHSVYDWDIFQILRSTTGGIGGLVLMAVIDWRFAIVVFVFGTVSVVVSAHYAKRLEAIGSEQQEQLAKTGTGLYELIKAAKAIRLLRLEARKRKELAENTEKEVVIKEKAMQTTAKLSAAITAISLLTNLAMLFSGALFVYYKLSNWGTVVALLSLKVIADMLFVECGQFIAGMQLNIAGIKRLFALIDVEEEALVLPAFAKSGTNAVLALESVDFSYTTNQPVIRNFSMTLKSRTLMALVGESGCGKSTIMRLILGLYPPDAGSLSFAEETGGITQRIRAQTAYVPQEPLLFHGSVYENIAFGREGATLDDVKLAAKQAGADEFIETMKDGYATELSDDGGNLSGGQKQRIAIARALVKDSPILLLDEITSALDKQTEAQILQTISEISKRKAVLFITHKEDVLLWADEVYAMR